MSGEKKKKKSDKKKPPAAAAVPTAIQRTKGDQQQDAKFLREMAVDKAFVQVTLSKDDHLDHVLNI